MKTMIVNPGACSPLWRNILLEDDSFDSAFYFHGKLEDMVGYDIGEIVNAISGGFESAPGKMCLEGIIPVRVLGIHKPCTGYFWTVFDIDDDGRTVWKRLRGLIVLNEDKEANAFAKAKLAARAKRL